MGVERMKTMRASTNCQLLYPVCLQALGTVVVRTGDEVQRGDIIAETRLPERFLVYDVMNQLKLSSSNVEKYIHRLVGESFVPGDVIAQKPGLFSRLFRARQNGKVVSIRDGKIGLALGEAIETVSAPFPGVITEIIYQRGAVIAALGSVAEAILSGNKPATGELIFTRLDLDHRKHLENEAVLAGKIVFCQSIEHVQQLTALIEAEPIGLVLGSVSPRVYKNLRNSKMPWLLLGGFGIHELDSQTLSILDLMRGETVYLVEARTDYPPMLVCLKNLDEKSPDLFSQHEDKEVRIGSRVKLWGQPYQGRVGWVIELPKEPEESACGEMMMPVVVRLTDELTVRVPQENLVKMVD